MNEIRDVIRTLSKHRFRSVSNVVGEFVERQIALTLGGTQANHCQKGFDVLCKDWGNIEVKSRNYYAKSKQCTLPAHKIDSLDNFILAIVKDGECLSFRQADPAVIANHLWSRIHKYAALLSRSKHH